MVDTNSTCFNESQILGYRLTLNELNVTVNETVYQNYTCLVSILTDIMTEPKRIMIIHGGFGGARKGNYVVAAKLTVYLDDTWKYDLDTLKW